MQGGEPRAEVGVGFVGLGDRGRHLLGALLSIGADPSRPRPRVVALADVNPRNLKKGLDIAAGLAPAGEVEGGGPSAAHMNRPRGHSDYRALLDDRGIDAVFLATPVHLHAEQALDALAAGKHVYCEKPLGGSVEECRRVLSAARAAERSGKIFQIGFQRRYSQRYVESVRFIHEGGAGRVLFVRAQWHAAGGPRRGKPWIFQRDRSGDIVLEQACHQFDVFNWVFDSPPLRACGLGGINSWPVEPPGRDVMDHYGAVLEYAGGAKVHMSHLSFAIPDRRFSGIYELVFLVWTMSGETRQLVAEGGNDTREAISGFLRSMGSGERPRASVDAGYLGTLTALLCRKALETGRTVYWKEIESS